MCSNSVLFQTALLKLSFHLTFQAGNFASALRNDCFTVLYLDLGAFGGSNPYVVGNPQPELSDKMFSPVEVNLIGFKEMKEQSPTKTNPQIQKQIILKNRLRIQDPDNALKFFRNQVLMFLFLSQFAAQVFTEITFPQVRFAKEFFM